MRNLNVALVTACAVVVGWAFTASADGGTPAYEFLAYADRPTTSSPVIDTGVVPTETMEFRFKYAMLTTSTWSNFFSSYKDENTESTRIITKNGSAVNVYAYFLSKAGGGSTAMSGVTKTLTDVREGYINISKAKVNSVEVTLKRTSTTTKCENPMVLFGYNTRCWYFSVLDDGAYTHHYLPCRRTADGVVGLWDVVAKSFVEPTGGALTAGPANDDYRLDANDVCQFRVVATARGQGTVAVGGGEAGTTASAWGNVLSSLTTTVTATPAEGWRFICWEGDVEGLTAAEKVLPTVTVTAGKALALTAVFCYELPASAYVQDGLIAQWDGIENAGAGLPHDPSAAYPQELVSGIEQTLTGTMSAGDDYFTLGAGYTSFKLPAMFAAINAGHATVEMYAGRDGTVAMVNNAGFVALGKSTRAFWAYQYSNYFIIASSIHAKASGEYQNLNFNDAGENTVSFLMGDSTATSEWRVNGVSKGTLDRKATDASENDDCYLGYIPGYDKARARMYSLRFYNRKLSAADVAFNANIDKIRFESADPSELVWPDGCRVTADGTLQVRASVALGGAGGAVSVAGGGSEAWVMPGSTVMFTAVPNDGLHILRWTGGTPTQTGGNAYSVKVNSPLVLTGAVGNGFRVWTDETGDGLWSTDDNWSPRGVPQEGDIVQLDTGTVTLTNSTPRFAAVEITSTLAMSNWTTCLRAQTVNVASGGVIKPSCAFKDNEMSNRVWIACRDLDVQKGGAINANNLGYKSGNGPGWPEGVARTGYSNGGSYGGRSSDAVTVCYGSAREPTDPGTAGSGANSTSAGGAIRIEASGAVKVDGTVSANGGKSTIWSCSGSSGGGIYITCRTISGVGSVTATSADNTSANGHAGGGGGRIAVHYDGAAQDSVAASDCTIRFDTHGGMGSVSIPYPYSTALAGYVAPLSRPAGIGGFGSLWFTDNRFLLNDQWLFTGTWNSDEGVPDNLTIPHSLKIDSAIVSFDGTLRTIDVQGDLNIAGGYARSSGLVTTAAVVSVDGNATVGGGYLQMRGGILNVAGDLLMTGGGASSQGAQLIVYCMATNVTHEAFGAEVHVGGDWRLEKYAVVYPHAHGTDGAIPYFEAKNFYMLPGTRFDASWYGYAAGNGPGAGTDTGASHGGRGGGTKVGKAVYGSRRRPLTAGSGGNFAGGGVIRVHAQKRMEMDGTLLAQGNTYRSNWNRGSAGGSVFLSAGHFSSTNGVVNARGGCGTQYSRGVGGGGRFAAWAYVFENTNVTISVQGGDPTPDGNDTVAAEKGTEYWHQIGGLMLLVR